jgi:thioredoxin 1
MIDVTGDLEKAIELDECVVYFTASWCAPCKQLKPVYAKIGMQDKNKKYFVIDVDTIDKKYLNKYNIMSVPKIFKFSRGEISKEIIGRTEQEIIEQIDN